jgi:hypothetical protein
VNGSENRSTCHRERAKLTRVKRGLILIFLLACCVAATPLRAEFRALAEAGFAAERPRFQIGDDPRWARSDFDDQAWTSAVIAKGPPLLPTHAGPFWVRARLQSLPAAVGQPPDGLVLSLVAAYELYWDGTLIARNGVVGRDPASEVPGVLDCVVRIPDALRGPGPHVVALRMSSYHAGFPSPNFGLTVWMGDYREILTTRAQKPMGSLLAAGGALVFAVVFGLMWLLTDRRTTTLVFSGLCLTAALMQALQAWRWLFDYPFSWHYPRLVAISCLVMLLGFLLVTYVQLFFDVPHRLIRLALVGVLLIAAWQVSPLYHYKSMAAAIAAFIATAIAASSAAARGRRSAWLVLAGLAISAIVLRRNPSEFLEQSFFMSFGAPLLGCVTAHVLQWREERRQAQAALLTSARLEVELLKKNIQPHFLMNSLASLLEVIEQSPAGAGPLIEALAGEFRILARISGEKLISLRQELELCECHLRVMSMRQGTSWRLEHHGLDLETPVPPALFHTLIENGITHSEGRARHRVFALSGEVRGGITRFVLVAPVADEGAPTSPAAHVNGKNCTRKRAGDGTGLRYVKARLEESFPGRWQLDAGPTPEGWRSTIEIRNLI